MKYLFLIIILVSLFACNNSKHQQNNTKPHKVNKQNYENKPVKYSPIIKRVNNDTLNVTTNYYKNGVKKSQGILINGKRQGHWIYWYKNGNIWSEGDFKDGKSEGMFTIYKPNGKKFLESFYKNGTKYKDIYYKDGKVYRKVDIKPL